MKGDMQDDGYFDENVAPTYDADTAISSDEAVTPIVDFLADLADGGRALEFAVGTGRIALPLAQRGVPVSGIELSQAMLDQLQNKPGHELIEYVRGDMTTAQVAGSFSLVYLVFNTIGNVTTQDGQVECFRNAAAHLAPGGCFVIEVGVPELRRLPPGERFHIFEASADKWGIDEYDVANQGLVSHHIRFRNGEAERLSMPFRYVWPAELDLMAQLAGLALPQRWADWTRAPFTSESRSHVSVWEKPAS